MTAIHRHIGMCGGVLLGLALAACAPTSQSESSLFGDGFILSALPLDAPDPAPIRSEIESLADLSPASLGPTDSAPAQAIAQLGEQAKAALSDPKLSKEQRVKVFHEMLAREVDIPVIARFALGRHWKAADETQRAAYVDAFGAFILQSYAVMLSGADISVFEVTGTQPTGKADTLVHTHIERAVGEPLDVAWRVRPRDDGFAIIDVMVEGVSIALTRRHEITSIMRASDGDLNALIDKLKTMAAAARERGWYVADKRR